MRTSQFIDRLLQPLERKLDYHAICQCSDETSGNFYDFIPLPQNRLALSMGNLPQTAGSITISGMQAITRGLAVCERNPASLACELNFTHHLLGPTGFCTQWFYAAIDPERNELKYVNAGHNSPFLIQRKGRLLRRLDPTGAALGLSQRSSYRHGLATVESGDILVAPSDAIADALSETEILVLVRGNLNACAAELARILIEQSGAPRCHEDRSVAVVRVICIARQVVLRTSVEEVAPAAA
jgi:sigma-B regulation protein RsbU (phosphoserine phosphatase)